MKYLLTFLLIAAVQGGIAQSIHEKTGCTVNDPEPIAGKRVIAFCDQGKWHVFGKPLLLCSDADLKPGETCFLRTGEYTNMRAKPSNVSSDITALSFSENHGTTPKPLLTVAAPQPLVEKAVADTNKGHCKPCLETNCTMDCKWEFSYTCPKHDGFHVFLLPDESTGEKYCLIIPKEK